MVLPSRTKKNSTRHRGSWQHDSGFKRLTRFRWRRISQLCKMKLFLSITAGCKWHSLQNRRYRYFCALQASTKASTKHACMRPARSASHCATGWALQASKRQTARTLRFKPGRATAVPTCRAKPLSDSRSALASCFLLEIVLACKRKKR